MDYDAVSAAYIVAGLRVGQDLDGFVDAYYGPESLRQAARDTPSPSTSLEAAREEIRRLDEDARKTFFEDQLRAMAEAIEPSENFRSAVERTYGVRPQWTEQSKLAEARASLDGLLEGTGTLADRLRAHRQRYEISARVALSVSEGLACELRARTSSILELPEREGADIVLVSNQPWSGYNWYLGNLRSRIEINTDLPILASSLPDLIAHEIYCGHHTEQVVKEASWARQRGWGEASIVLLNSPQALISEGIATNALGTLVSEADWAEWTATFCYGPAGVDGDPLQDRRLQTTMRTLGRAHGNAALMLHDQGATPDETADYLVEEAVMEPERARQMVRFISTPSLRGYVFNYIEGLDAVARFLAASTEPQRAFRELLERHWTPSLLARRGEGRFDLAG
jgi:hypothetical protein